MSGNQGYLAVNGVEVINQARTLAYLRAGLSGRGQWEVSDGSCCAALTRDAFPLSTCTPGAGVDEFATNPLGTRLLAALGGAVSPTWSYDTTGEGALVDVLHTAGETGLYFPSSYNADCTIVAELDLFTSDPALLGVNDEYGVYRVDNPGTAGAIGIGGSLSVGAGVWRLQAELVHPTNPGAVTVAFFGGAKMPGRVWLSLTTLNDGVTVALYELPPSTGMTPLMSGTGSIQTMLVNAGLAGGSITLSSATRVGLGALKNTSAQNGPGRYNTISWSPACTNTGHLYPSDGLWPMDTIYPDFYGDFRNPGVDLAPWYSSSQPASADFLGALLASPWDGADPNPQRDVQNRYGGVQGAAIGPEVIGPRTLKARVVLVSASCQGMEYGRRWFADVLGQGLCDACSLPFIDVRFACPPADGSDDARGKWRLYEVALIDLAEQVGEAADEQCFYSVFDITLLAGDGWLYKAPVTLQAATALNAGASDATLVSFDQWLCATPTPVCSTVTRPNIGVTAPIITIAAGPNGLASGVVWQSYGVYPANGLYPSDCLYPADGPTQFSNLACPVQFLVPTLSANQQITIDNSRKRVTLVGADGTLLDGTPFLQLAAGQTLSWIDTEACQATDLQVCAGVSASCGADDQAAVLIQAQHRER